MYPLIDLSFVSLIHRNVSERRRDWNSDHTFILFKEIFLFLFKFPSKHFWLLLKFSFKIAFIWNTFHSNEEKYSGPIFFFLIFITLIFPLFNPLFRRFVNFHFTDLTKISIYSALSKKINPISLLSSLINGCWWLFFVLIMSIYFISNFSFLFHPQFALTIRRENTAVPFAPRRRLLLKLPEGTGTFT